MGAARRKRRDFRTVWLYGRAVLREFRGTLAALAIVVAVGAAIYRLTPQAELAGQRPDWALSLYGAWMALFAQPVFQRPDSLLLDVMQSAYPLFGFVLVGEGVVRFALLMLSRRRGEKEWMLVMASTYRDHVIVCGLGHLGYRVLEQLLEQGRAVVAIEKDPNSRFHEAAKAAGIPLLIRDMKEDAALVDAGVEHAAAIVLATNDDLGNLEAALDARRMNPRIRVALRMFDQKMAGKLQDAFAFDAPFSSAALAAPAVAAMIAGPGVVGSTHVGGVPHVAAEIRVERRSPLVGRTVAHVEADGGVRVLCRQPERGEVELPPAAGAVLDGGDLLTVHVAVAGLERVRALARGGTAPATPGRS